MRWTLMLLVLLVPAVALAGGKEIQLWYGDTQSFGQPGLAQPCINVLGSVSEPESVLFLAFSLNGWEFEMLPVGPDGRRLARSGDFNVEIHSDRLRQGDNSLVIRAEYFSGEVASAKVQVRYEPGVWPLPYELKTAKGMDVQRAVQVVDGLWVPAEEGLRLAAGHVGYDRSVAIGTSDWKDYEAQAVFTVHGLDEASYESSISKGPALGMILHWQGHTNAPVRCGKPRCGWLPAGCMAWYKFGTARRQGLNLLTGMCRHGPRLSEIELQPGVRYALKVRWESSAGGGLCQAKLWRPGLEPEPEAWMLETLAGMESPASGGVLFVAHHVDLCLHELRVEPLQ